MNHLNIEIKKKLRRLYTECSKVPSSPFFRRKDSLKKYIFIETKIMNIYDIDLHVLDDIEEYFNERIDEMEFILKNNFRYGISTKSIKVNEENELLDGWHRLFMKIFNHKVFPFRKDTIKVSVFKNK